MSLGLALRSFAVCFLLIPGACAPLPQLPFSADADLVPPEITSMEVGRDGALALGFSEPCELLTDSVLPGDSLRSSAVQTSWLDQNRSLVFSFDPPPAVGKEHFVEAQVQDASGNNLRFVAKFYGSNALLPAMVVNEFTTQGSGGHPDFVEIRVLTAGNIAGACLLEGTPEDWESRYIFPDIDVYAGDYLVVHFKPQGIGEEVNETENRSSSGGYDSSSGAWDYWVADGNGLSGNNGVLTLCETPVGGVIDAVIYSNRTSESDDQYRGFGSAGMVRQVDYVEEHSSWAGHSPLAPEDAVNPEDSTGTRSMCRNSAGSDTNTREDWHITPTRGLSPGGPNSDEVYGG